MNALKIYLTPLSHFSRKVRILLDLYGVNYEALHIGNVAESSAEIFAHNPLMSVPIIQDADVWMIESDHIAEYLVRKFDDRDRYNVLSHKIQDLNIRAVLNGIMENEVKIILAERTQLPTSEYQYFRKAEKAIHQGLTWLNERHREFTSDALSYREFHFICLWEHLVHYKMFRLEAYSDLSKLYSEFARSPLFSVIQRSSPEKLLVA